jgi:hypothetical protein
MSKDLASRQIDDKQGAVLHGDASDPRSWRQIQSSKAQGSVSSPPYLNNFDYADATRLEAYFWGEASTWSEMCTNIRAKMLTATTQQSSAPKAREAELQLGSCIGDDTAATIKEITSKLTTERKARKRGKEYDQVIPAYFASIGLVLQNLSVSLEIGAPVVWLIGDSAPYGVHIDTPSLIGRVAKSFNLECEKDVALRQRGLRWSGNTSRHGVALSERLLLLRRR